MVGPRELEAEDGVCASPSPSPSLSPLCFTSSAFSSSLPLSSESESSSAPSPTCRRLLRWLRKLSLGLSLCVLCRLCVEKDGRRKEEGSLGRRGGGSPAPDSRRAKIAAGTLGKPVLDLRGDDAVEDVGVMPWGERCPDVDRGCLSSLCFDREPGLWSFCFLRTDASTVIDRGGSGGTGDCGKECTVGMAAGAEVE